MEDYRIQRPATSACSITRREFSPGETFYAVLIEDGENYVRQDFSLEAWSGPPPGTVGYWKAKIPEKRAPARQKLAVNDILLAVFDHLREPPRPNGHPSKGGEYSPRPDKLYILTLLMIRRRILRLDEELTPVRNLAELSVYCPRRDESYMIPVAVPDAGRQQEIQEEITRLLSGESTEIIEAAENEPFSGISVDEIVLPEIPEELIIDN